MFGKTSLESSLPIQVSLGFVSNARTMSEPPNTTTSQHIILHHQPPTPPHPLSTTTTSTSLIREYRKGNWNLHETLVLITAKKLDDERRAKASTTPPDPTAKHTPTSHQQQQQCRTAELRWKWVENYCWKNGCLRSQNQCNDKWDNLLRDYKKVREYEARRSNTTDDQHLPSYWILEKHQRKERNLPTNLLSEIYEALNQVVHRRYSSKTLLPPTPIQVVLRPMETLPPPPLTTEAGVSAETSDSSEADESEKLDPATKRRKVRRLGSSIVKSASVLARTIMTCEEKKEKRHRDILELEERRLRIEEARNEVNREGLAGLISAVTDLSGAILALVSDSTNGGGDGAT